jgi:methionyl-tRNA formyltransferase
LIKDAVFLGSKKFGLELFRSLYLSDRSINWTLLTPQDSSDLRSSLVDFRSFAGDQNIEMIEGVTPKSISQYLQNHKTDVMIVCGYYRILPIGVMRATRLGVFGFHNSLLPKYRGGSPLVWQMINNEEVLGSSFFKFDLGVDDGPVFEKVSIPNVGSLEIGQAMDLLEHEWIQCLPEVWRRFCQGEATAIEQNHSLATYCSQRQEWDGEINWNMAAWELDCFIRAQSSPYPRAYFLHNKKRFGVVRHTVDDRTVYGIPGQVLGRNDSYVTICCGNNSAIKISTLEVEGEEVLAAGILNSIKIRL